MTEAEAAPEENGGLPEMIRVRGFRFDKRDSHKIRVAEGTRWVFAAFAWTDGIRSAGWSM